MELNWISSSSPEGESEDLPGCDTRSIVIGKNTCVVQKAVPNMIRLEVLPPLRQFT